MTLPEKVRDVTQSEWLEVRERLAAAESQLALAMAWGAEVCAMFDETEHAMHMRIRGEYDRTIADSWRAKVAEVEQRAERAEAERDEARACWHRDVAKGRAAIEKRDADLAAARAQLAAVVAAVLPCSICHGLGVYATACSMCGDSTYEHECDDKVAPCPAPACGDLRRALADTAQAAREHDERVRAEERERCAVVCDMQAMAERDDDGNGAAQSCAERIRALGSRS